MTKKDYEIIAGSIYDSIGDIRDFNFGNKELDEAINEAIEHVVANIALALGEQNPRFSREKFLTACGIEIK